MTLDCFKSRTTFGVVGTPKLSIFTCQTATSEDLGLNVCFDLLRVRHFAVADFFSFFCVELSAIAALFAAAFL